MLYQLLRLVGHLVFPAFEVFNRIRGAHQLPLPRVVVLVNDIGKMIMVSSVKVGENHVVLGYGRGRPMY
jgi:hypothetical protein